MVSFPSPQAKKPRYSRRQAREAVLDAGRRLLTERGLDAGLGFVSFNEAIVESGVPRASAYRVFGNTDLDPQMAFRRELLISYIETDPMEARREAFDELAGLALTMLKTDDPIELARNLREIIRSAFAGQYAPIGEDPNWRVVGPSWAATALAGWAPESLIEAHRQGTMATVEYLVPLYRQVAEAAGIRPRPGSGWEEWVLMTYLATMTESFAARYHPELQAIMRPTGPNGELQPWTQSALVVEGLIRTSLEVDPDATVSADLSVWDR